MITEKWLRELLDGLSNEEGVRAVAHAMSQLTRHSGITEALIASYVNAGGEKAKTSQYHPETLNPLFYHQTVRARLESRLRREAVDVSQLNLMGKQGKVTDLHNVYIHISCVQIRDDYIQSDSKARKKFLAQVDQIIAFHHWSLGKDEEQSSEEELVYYWPSNYSRN